MNKLKGIQRDIISLGGIFFYLVVILFSLLFYKRELALGLILGFVFLVVLALFFKFDKYVARAIVLAFFLIFEFFQNISVTISVVLLLVMVVFSSYKLKTTAKIILKSILFGLVSSGITLAIIRGF